jgi:hypothetical protein
LIGFFGGFAAFFCVSAPPSSSSAPPRGPLANTR